MKGQQVLTCKLKVNVHLYLLNTSLCKGKFFTAASKTSTYPSLLHLFIKVSDILLIHWLQINMSFRASQKTCVRPSQICLHLLKIQQIFIECLLCTEINPPNTLLANPHCLISHKANSPRHCLVQVLMQRAVPVGLYRTSWS